MSKESARFRLAYDRIVAGIESGEFEETRHLPSIAALARLADVSVSTMWKVVNALKTQGRLVGKSCHRVSLPGAPAEGGATSIDNSALPRERKSKHTSLRVRIQHDILNGRHAYDAPLPTAKVLAAHYGVSRTTLRKSLLALTEKGILSHRGTRFRPATSTGPSPAIKPRIVLLGFGPDIGLTITWGHWHLFYLNQLEIECAKAGIALDVVCFMRTDAGLQLVDGHTGEPTDLACDSSVLGYIYEVIGRESVDEELLNTITRWDRPVAILDEVGIWPTTQFVKRHPNVRIFRNTVATLPAQQVARYLLELGHRSAIFISPYHGWEYSVRRFRGLQQAFAVDEKARIVSLTPAQELPDYQEQGIARVNLRKMMSFYAGWKKALPRTYTTILDQHFELLKSISATGRVLEELESLLVRALEITDATAWITVNDGCASFALDFLTQRGRTVPGDISIISFDNLPEALKLGISSYDFNQSGMVTAMFSYITNLRLDSFKRPVIEIEGRIIPRRTTGRPRG